MRLNASKIDQMPQTTSHQVRRRNAAQKKLKEAQKVEQMIEDTFVRSMAADQTPLDRSREQKHLFTHATENSEVRASNQNGTRELYQREPGDTVSYARVSAFSTLYSSSKTTVTNRLLERGDKTIYTTRKTYKDSRCPYPNETTTVIKKGEGEEATYRVYDGWLASKAAQFGLL